LCPNCGSDEITIFLSFSNNLGDNLKDCLKGKSVDSSLPSKKKIRKEFVVGADKRKCDDKWMEKLRVIDKENDFYKEEVIDPSTGEVIHHCEEKLSEHFGHGSAKKKN
jgi:hypothetical protein